MDDIKLLNNLNYVLIKYPYLIKKEINDIDVLLSNDDYYKAIKILESRGFKISLSEFNEKYKTLLSKFTGKKFIKIHLHREIAWNGVIALDKNLTLKRKRIFKGFYVPSIEDSLLINTAHILLELKKIRAYEKKLFSRIKQMPLDFGYIQQHLEMAGWKEQFFDLFNHNRISRKKTIISIIKNNPYLSFNFFTHYLKWVISQFKLSRKIVIALLGPDGSGKSTIAKELKRYNFKVIYGGWKDHYLFTSKLLAYFGKTKAGMKKQKEFQLKREKKITFLQELIYLNYVFEHLARYAVGSFLRFRHNIVFDRYFIDVLMQDKNAEKSKIIKLAAKFFPKPKYIFYLFARPKVLINRKKHEKLEMESVIFQQKQLKKLMRIFPMIRINNEKEITETINHILSIIWRKI